MVVCAPLAAVHWMRPFDGKVRAIGAYGAAVATSVVAAVFLLELWRADLRVPFDYGGDALLYSLITKSTVDHGWFWTNPSVGAPSGLELYDFPASAHDSLHLVLIKAMSVFTTDWATLFNVYFLLGFPLTTLSAMAVFRRFGVGYGPAALGAVLYAFLPSRLIKGEGHIFMDVFYQVPLAILVVLWVCGPDPPLFRDRAEGRWPRLELRAPRSWGSLVLCAVTASTSLYYAYFTTCLLVGGGAWASLQRRSVRNVAAGVALAGALVVGLAANGLPAIVYHAQHGTNHEVAQRKPWEAELYGMRIAQLLLPVDAHRLAGFRQIKRRYEMHAPLPGESGATSLGVVGDVGFLCLLGVVLAGRRAARGDPGDWKHPLAVLNLMAVLLGTIGGFGSIIAWLVTPQIRTYARIGVLIGFFALFAVVLMLERLRRHDPLACMIVVPILIVVGLLDQAPPGLVRAYDVVKKRYDSDEDLVRRIERAVPAGTIVLELPFMTFPEGPPLNRLEGYDPLRLYLHSRSVRWTYPAMRGREEERWVVAASQREPRSMLDALAETDVGGIVVMRDGYADDGAGIEGALTSLLGREPIVSADHRLAFFSIGDKEERLRAVQSPAARAYAAAVALHPLGFDWDDGCFGVEHERDTSFRWCGSKGEIVVDNQTNFVRRASIHATLIAAKSPANLAFEGDVLSARLALSGETPFARTLEVPPGRHVVRFDCDSQRAPAPWDPRVLIWRVENFAFDELPPTAP